MHSLGWQSMDRLFEKVRLKIAIVWESLVSGENPFQTAAAVVLLLLLLFFLLKVPTDWVRSDERDEYGDQRTALPGAR